jgi:hypothetical protein
MASPAIVPPLSPSAKVAAYVALMKLRVVELLLVTTVPVMVVANYNAFGKGMPSLWLMVATVVGGTLSAGGLIIFTLSSSAASSGRDIYDSVTCCEPIRRSSLVMRTSNKNLLSSIVATARLIPSPRPRSLSKSSKAPKARLEENPPAPCAALREAGSAYLEMIRE